MNKVGILMDYVVIYEEGENSCSAYVPDLPGCIAAGDTVDEVNSLISEAIEYHIEIMKEDGEVVPLPTLNLAEQTVIPGLGKHKILETYVYSDRPTLFSCKNAAGHIYFVSVYENSRDETWHCVRISSDRFNYVRSGAIDLRSTFVDAEDSIVLQIKVSYDNPSQPITKYIKSDQILDEMVPFSGETLRLKTDNPFC